MQSVNAKKTMEEEFLKRNTDCVYFLASPLTCKKGMDCEYRHSEIARFNPRDCWYWLAGNCSNPTCGFRHPPLDGQAQITSESAILPYQFSTPANNTSIPCYFYFNGFCNKGDRCSFSHGQDDSVNAGKVLKTDAPLLDHKTSTENDAGTAPTETNLNEFGTAQKPSNDPDAQLEEELEQSAPKNMPSKTVSPKVPLFEFEEAPLHKSGSLLLHEVITESGSPICSDESLEEKVDDHVEPDERGESSPGFDVLVDNKSEDLEYENDSEYLLAPDREQMDPFMNYKFEEVQHEARYPCVELPYDQDVNDAYEGSDNEFIIDNVRNPPIHRIYRRLDSTFFQKKRRLLAVEPSYNDELGVDLRDILRKRRIAECNSTSFWPRRSEYPHLIDRSSERPQRNGIGQKSRRRLASKVEKYSFESIGDQRYLSYGTNQCGRLKHSEPNCSIRRSYREKWQPKQKSIPLAKKKKQKSIPSEVSRNLIRRERNSSNSSTAFTGPKTLAQIKEEKRKTEDGGIRHSSRTTSADFQGPKPLSEILKDKGRLDTVKD